MMLKNLWLALKEQGPLKRAFRNFFVTGNAWGMFSIYSHIRRDTKQPKMRFKLKEHALKAADSIGKRNHCHFSTYKCIWCDGYHIGKNRDNKQL
jgi:hypothetical protein